MTPSQSSSSTSKHFTTPKEKDKTSTMASGGYKDESAYSGYLNTRVPKDPQTIGFKMSQHGLKLNDRPAFDRYPEFKEMAYGIVDRASVKAPEPTSEKKFQRVVDDYGRSNEATFLGLAFGIMIKDGYFVMEDSGASGPPAATFKDFILDEDIAISMDRELRGTLLPHRYTNQGFEKEMTLALKKDDGMKNAKPDYIYGISERKLAIQSGPPLTNMTYKLLTIAKGMYHPFLLVEGKSDRGSVAEAIDQARRGGATLVHATRIIADLVNHDWKDPDPRLPEFPASPSQQPTPQATPHPEQQQPRKPTAIGEGADTHTFVYSAIVSPQVVSFYVHWHEQIQLPDGTFDSIFHMNTVASQSVQDERRALGEIRRILHNICKWGAGERYLEHKKIHGAVRRYSEWYYRNQQLQSKDGKKRKLNSEGASARASIVEDLELESDREGR
ncbi:MAG: hypothetical protein Q9164_007380 [Protoblastenia rupestris]